MSATAYCTCELRNRRWNPLTLICEFCGRRFYERRLEPVEDE